MNDYPEGSLVRLTATFTDEVTGEAADPDDVTVSTSVNGATPTDQSEGIVRDSAGVYHVDVDTTGLPGQWTYQWAGTGAVQAVNWSGFVVLPSPV